MKKLLYIIPGWEDVTSDKSYQQIAEVAREKGYEVIFRDINWKESLSKQVFSVPENSVILGFSLGAILTWLVAQKNPCEHLILASMTPHYSFKDQDIKEALIDLAGTEFVEDVIKNLESSHLSKKQTVIYGDQEGEEGDILVTNVEHGLTANYIEEIRKIL